MPKLRDFTVKQQPDSNDRVLLFKAADGSENAILMSDLLAYMQGDMPVRLKLLPDDIPNTVQTYEFQGGSGSSVSKVLHKSEGVAVRTDVFAYGTDTITETRTLSTGEKLTITTNLTTLETTVTQS